MTKKGYHTILVNIKIYNYLNDLANRKDKSIGNILEEIIEKHIEGDAKNE